MNGAADWPGAAERKLARQLVEEIAPEAPQALAWRGVSLRPTAEHLLYTALRRAELPSTGGESLSRSILRIGRAALPARAGRAVADPGRTDVLALVTQPVHVTLFGYVSDALRERDLDSQVIDAETRSGRSVAVGGVTGRLAESLERRAIPSLAGHARAVYRDLRRVPRGWSSSLEQARAEALFGILRRGLCMAALDAARLRHVVRARQPRLLVCFSESGILARIAPAVAQPMGIPVVDLPHAEANDPHGTAGVQYDSMLVYGPYARAAIEASGVPADRIQEIGPLRFDALIAAGEAGPAERPRRIVFASQPIDLHRTFLHPDVRQLVVEAALAATRALTPAELVVVPHPTESAATFGRFAGDLAGGTVPVRIESDLHAALRGAWLLITASSQSVFDAIVSGVPAATVSAIDRDPVNFAGAGISAGVTTAEAAGSLAAGLRSSAERQALLDRQRAALGRRIGPLDGQAARRAASRMRELIDRTDREGGARG